MTPRLTAIGLAGVAVLALAAAGLAQPGHARGAQPAKPPVQSIQEIMDTIVDPSADALWAVAGTVETPGKSEVRQPRTPAEWASARALAVALIDGSRRLAIPRPVGSNGHWVLADANTPGIRNSRQIQRDIARDPARFRAAAGRLEKTAGQALAAIDARNVPALMQAGANIDAACESCHSAYWYPRRAPGPLPSPQAFAKLSVVR